ncbi:MAG: HD domain-containing protein [Bacteroidales bacterium]|nr:HD domain-containing protein [Bacteroidales bacterium]
MQNHEKDELIQLIAAPYIQKATALIGIARKVGGNQFRHMMATFTILIDYHYTSHVLLKAALIHDLFEDVPESSRDEIRKIDAHGHEVVTLVEEVTRYPHETKIDYLEKIMKHGSRNAKILKVADRISNITDLHLDIMIEEKMANYLEQTIKYVYPMAEEVNHLMAIELRDLVERRKMYLNAFQ